MQRAFSLPSGGHSVAWSPDGRRLAVATPGLAVVDVESGERFLERFARPHRDVTADIAWSSDGAHLAALSRVRGVRVIPDGQSQDDTRTIGGDQAYSAIAWRPGTHALLMARSINRLAGDDPALMLSLVDVTTGGTLWRASCPATPGPATRGYRARPAAWSWDGTQVAVSTADRAVWTVGAEGDVRLPLVHRGRINDIAWSPDDGRLATACGDGTIRIWDPTSGARVFTLEGDLRAPEGCTFSCDGRWLAAVDGFGSCVVYGTDDWRPAELAELRPAEDLAVRASIRFHPSDPTRLALAGPTVSGKAEIWALSETRAPSAVEPQRHYVNARVILAGDSGVGKSALGLVLAGQDFAPTESTHGRHIWTLDSSEETGPTGSPELRETFLWDLAGQPGYRMLHQLYLSDADVAIVVFDARYDEDPLSGVRYWARALDQAELIDARSGPRMRRLLVAARADRGFPPLDEAGIGRVVEQLGFDGYYATSAKESFGIANLADAVRAAIAWDELPRVSSSALFLSVKSFLVDEKKTGALLSTPTDLLARFLRSGLHLGPRPDLELFVKCIARLEAEALVRSLSFGGFVLLQPEVLDAYGTAIINAARADPAGFGSIAEDDVLALNFLMPEAHRVIDPAQEHLLLRATIEELVRRELVLREHTEAGPQLVFPSELTRHDTSRDDVPPVATVFTFEGAINPIYATLVVRLSRTGRFSREEGARGVAEFTANTGGRCGLVVLSRSETVELGLFFGAESSAETRFQFEDYVLAHLDRHAVPGSIRRTRVFVCPSCGVPMSREQVAALAERGLSEAGCPVCRAKVPLDDPLGRRAARTGEVHRMDRAADEMRDREANDVVFETKVATTDFDVFLCHNGEDKEEVKAIARRLKERGVLPWLDEWQLRPGLPWQRALEETISRIRTAAVFIGRRGVGPWQRQELDAFLRKFANTGSPVIPVLLETAPDAPELPVFLEGMTWVDFRTGEPDPFERLLWGITDRRPDPR